MTRVWLDHAGSTPLHPAARATLLAALDDGWADPGRLAHESRRAGALLEAARQTVAAALGARPDEVFFTASGTSAVQAALQGVLASRSLPVVTSAVEHSAVLHVAGDDASVAAVDHLGRVDLAGLAHAGPHLLSLQVGNHEVGTRQPLAEAARAAKEQGGVVHTDAHAALGRVPLDLAGDLAAVDLLTGTARGWGGPAGVGVLFVRTGTRWRSPWPGSGPEHNAHPGALDLPAVLAAAASLAAAVGDLPVTGATWRSLTDRVRKGLAEVDDTDVLGDPVDRLPHVVTGSCLYVDGEALLGELDAHGVAVASGSACVADVLAPSHVLAAMGALTHGNVRVSVGYPSTDSDVDRLLELLGPAVARQREGLGL